MLRRLVRAGLIVMILVVAGFLLVTWHTNRRYADAFEHIGLGDSREHVVALFGEPSVTEYPGRPFLLYASGGCSGRCTQRLWFENRLMPGIEAWSLELDAHGQVIDKGYWLFP